MMRIRKPCAPLSKVPRIFWRAAGLFCGLALLFGSASAQAQLLRKIWRIGTNDPAYSYINTDSTQRGIAYNPAYNQVVVLSRTGGNIAAVLDAETGAEVGKLNTSGISGGTLTFNMVACGDDGAVYVFNLQSTAVDPPASSSLFKIYRWNSTEVGPAPSIAYHGDPGNGALMRWGDQIASRGGGTSTEFLVGSTRAGSLTVGATNVALFKTADGINFTHYRIDVSGVPIDALKFGLAFYTNNTFFAKTQGGSLYLIQYELTGPNSGVGTVLKSWASSLVPLHHIAVSGDYKLLAGNNITNRTVRLYDISNLGAGPVFLSATNFDTTGANANQTGALDFGGQGRTNRLYSLISNNGILASAVDYPSGPVPPAIITQPGNAVVYSVVSNVTLNVAASGTSLYYQWQKNSNDIPWATSSTLVLTNPTPADSGYYRVHVFNEADIVTSVNARVTVTAPKTNEVLSPIWGLPPGSRPYINTDNSQRGMDIDPITGNVLLVSRADGAKIYVIEPTSGADLATLNTAGITIGTFPLNMIGVADDGVVYAANLTTAANDFMIYRWNGADPEVLPEIAWGAPSGSDPSLGLAVRWGDNMAVRGAGATTQILLASRNNNVVSILTTTDGVNFTANPIVVTNAPGGFAGLGVAFGEGDTFYAKSSGNQLRKVAFSVTPGGNSGLVIGTNNINLNISAIDVDPQRNLLAGISLETPDNVQLYQIQSPTSSLLLDQEFFYNDDGYIDFANANGTGSAVISGTRLVALDSNNGLRAFSVTLPPGPLSITRVGSDVELSWPGGATLQSSSNAAGPYSDVNGATSPYTYSPTPGTQIFYRLKILP